MTVELPDPIHLGITPLQQRTIHTLITLVNVNHIVTIHDAFVSDHMTYRHYFPEILQQLAGLPLRGGWPTEWPNVKYKNHTYSAEAIHKVKGSITVSPKSLLYTLDTTHYIDDAAGVISFLRGFL